MENEKGKKVYRKLLYFLEKNEAVHFTTVLGGFHNGYIIDLNEKKLTLVLNEFKQGELPFLLEDIDPNRIVKFKEK